ncbi:hypothetical protein FE236_02540 [Mariprofundus erugo]|uniref:Uncharacterized protein n=1 Tax=Mariprofundus erugo TaxID=2528639 RepID=A0A5R9GL19_9PROT|nr:hypothetical protein [Mariprofundus erugo]TLS65699.1 hypothetical protein FEF65_12040 [Mariprofundus erugo]TLS77986.1 hypothetical protein FE236_02540 [Mariprofundus erugo]
MKKHMKSIMLAACMSIAAGGLVGTAQAEDQGTGLNPCDMATNPCNPCDMNSMQGDMGYPDAGNPCDQQAPDGYGMGDGMGGDSAMPADSEPGAAQ